PHRPPRARPGGRVPPAARDDLRAAPLSPTRAENDAPPSAPRPSPRAASDPCARPRRAGNRDAGDPRLLPQGVLGVPAGRVAVEPGAAGRGDHAGGRRPSLPGVYAARRDPTPVRAAARRGQRGEVRRVSLPESATASAVSPHPIANASPKRP